MLDLLIFVGLGVAAVLVYPKLRRIANPNARLAARVVAIALVAWSVIEILTNGWFWGFLALGVAAVAALAYRRRKSVAAGGTVTNISSARRIFKRNAA